MYRDINIKLDNTYTTRLWLMNVVCTSSGSKLIELISNIFLKSSFSAFHYSVWAIFRRKKKGNLKFSDWKKRGISKIYTFVIRQITSKILVKWNWSPCNFEKNLTSPRMTGQIKNLISYASLECISSDLKVIT